MKAILKTSAALSAVASFSAIGSSAFGAAASFSTVSALDPNNGTAITVADAASNSNTSLTGGGSGITFANFTTLVAAAYTSNTGGVLNFEAANVTTSGGTAANTTIGDSAANAVTATYGTSQANSIKFYRSDVNATATNAFDYNTNQLTLVASGGNGGGYLGIQGNAAFTMTFITPIVDFGLTTIPRADAQLSGGIYTVNYVNAITNAAAGSAQSTLVEPSTGTTPPTAVFFGVAAPTGDLISSVSFDASSVNGGKNNRFDDLAFIAAVPEPASLSLFGLGGLTLLRRRR